MRLTYPRSFLALLLIGFSIVAAPLLFALFSNAIAFERLAALSEQAVHSAVRVTQSSRALLSAITALERTARQYAVAGEPTYLEAYRANSVMWALVEQVSTIDPEIHRIRLLGRRAHVERVARTIRRWQVRGIADPEVDLCTTAGALVSMLSNFAYWWLAGGDTYEADVAAHTLTDIWARAVGLRARPAGR